MLTTVPVDDFFVLPCVLIAVDAEGKLLMKQLIPWLPLAWKHNQGLLGLRSVWSRFEGSDM